MKSVNQQWQQMRSEYLARIEQTLEDAPVQERRQILDEVSVHLDNRLSELTPDEQTWENMQQILTDMGPVEDYAALLEQKSELPKRLTKQSFTVWAIACIILAVLIGFLGTGGFILAKKYLQSRRPIVVQTTPTTLDNAVDPDTTQISVTFSRPMMNFSWSWVGGGEHYPETTGDPKYDKSRTTCTLPVKLQPGQWYWIGINSEKFVYFQTERHIPAKPYVILFATADENGNPTEIPQDYIEEAKRINSE